MMKRTLPVVGLLLILGAAGCGAADAGGDGGSEDSFASEEGAVDSAEEAVVYGADDRAEWYELTRAQKQVSDSDVALVYTQDLMPADDGVSTLLPLRSLSNKYSVCDDHPFAAQQAPAVCSGVLVGPKHVLTVGHCGVGEIESTLSIVFGFQLSAAGTTLDRVPNSEVYRILSYQKGSTDWMLLELDRVVPNHRIAPIRRDPVTLGQTLESVGHPFTVPLKYAMNSRVLVAGADQYGEYGTNVDGMWGMSGAMVIDATNKEVAGLLVSGPVLRHDDVNNCYYEHTCADDASDCEDTNVLQTSEFMDVVPGSSSTFFADVTGDGKDDAVSIHWGGVNVRPANSASFGGGTTWLSTVSFGLNGTFLADVDGDAKSDLVRVDPSGIRVRRSTGTSFGAETLWLSVGLGKKGVYFSDVNGDGRADALGFDNRKLSWRLSTGTSFGAATSITLEPARFGTFFADVDADGDEDMIMNHGATVHVHRFANGTFGAGVSWHDDTYQGTRATLFTDVSGDGRADAVAVDDVNVRVRKSTGSAFGAESIWSTTNFHGSRGTYAGDVNGDGRSDLIAVGDRLRVRLSAGSTLQAGSDWTTGRFAGTVGRVATAE